MDHLWTEGHELVCVCLDAQQIKEKGSLGLGVHPDLIEPLAYLFVYHCPAICRINAAVLPEELAH
jgi:hypothetical protein